MIPDPSGEPAASYQSLTRITTINLHHCVLQFRKVRETLHTSCRPISRYHTLVSVPVDVECHGIEGIDAICILLCAERERWFYILGSLIRQLLYIFGESLDLRF
jgi:hypothetical protein